jgi:hypothetical protein
VSQTQVQIKYCRRRKDEYGNRHDELAVQAVNIPSFAEVVVRGQTDTFRKMFVLEGDRVRVIRLMSFEYGKETVCEEDTITIEEACKTIQFYLNRKNVKVLVEPNFYEICKE